MPQQEYFGTGILTKELETILTKEKPHQIFLVTGKESYSSSGIKEKMTSLLSPYTFIQFQDFSVNPKIEDIKRGIDLYKKEKCDLTIAIGGGSVIDIAKSINILTRQNDKAEEYITGRKNIKQKGNNLIAIPTTAGSGSEATSFAVVYIQGQKYSLYHPIFMLPDYAIIDPELTFTCSPTLSSISGMDALTQAVESYWSVKSTPQSQEYSRIAINLILKNLETVVNNPTTTSREKMSKAANLAGKAINLTATTACHAMSYPLTSYFNIPHGQAVALTLGEIGKFNYEIKPDNCQDTRGVNYVKRTLDEIFLLFRVKSPEQFSATINKLMDNIKLERNLSKLNINPEDELEIIKDLNLERVKNNPRTLTPKQAQLILKNIR